MVRTSHFSQQVDLPVYAVDFVAPRVLVYVGGGGASKSGVKNKLVLAALEEELSAKEPKAQLQTLAELQLSGDEDAPMCMAVDRVGQVIACSVNSSPATLAEGNNKTLRLFRYTLPTKWQGTTPSTSSSPDEPTATLEPIESYRGLPITNPEDYPKVLALAPALESRESGWTPGPALLEAGTDGSVVVHPYPSISSSPLWAVAGPSAPATPAVDKSLAATSTSGTEPLFSPGDEIYDADFAPSGAVVALATAQTLRIVSSTGGAARAEETDAESSSSEEKAAKDKNSPVVVQTITNPEVGAGRGVFRSARFGSSGKVLYTVVNSSAARGAAKGAARPSFVSLWDVGRWALWDTRKVGTKPATTFAVAPSGSAVAVGGADLSVRVLDGDTLRLRTRILAAHSFPPTSLAFSPDGQWLVSASADNTLRCIRVPDAAESNHGLAVAAVLVALVLLIAALLIQQHRQS